MTRSPFLVHVARLRGRPGEREEVEAAGPLEELATSGATVDTDVVFQGTIEAIEGARLVAVGHARATWQGECRRCLKVASGDIDVAVREIYESDATEGETYPLDGDWANLEPMIRESIMLEIPVAPLCKDDCKGLCPECGVDRNTTDCDCEPDLSDPRWAALDALKGEG